MSDRLYLPKRLRNRARNGHDHTGGLIVPMKYATSVVPASWADSPPPRLTDKVQSFIAGLDDAKDGRRHNAYVCDTCQATLHTYERHPGVTPLSMLHAAMLRNSGCVGTFQSQGYPAGDPPESLGPPIMEWYRPSAEHMETATPRIVEHVMRGGLLLRRFNDGHRR